MTSTITLSGITDDEAPAGSAEWNEGRARLTAAMWIAAGLGVVILAGLAMLTYVGFLTYPTANEVKALLPSGTTGTVLLDSWKSVRGDWLTTLTTLAQTFVFGSLLPILGTVVGYVVGTRAESGGD